MKTSPTISLLGLLKLWHAVEHVYWESFYSDKKQLYEWGLILEHIEKMIVDCRDK